MLSAIAARKAAKGAAAAESNEVDGQSISDTKPAQNTTSLSLKSSGKEREVLEESKKRHASGSVSDSPANLNRKRQKSSKENPINFKDGKGSAVNDPCTSNDNKPPSTNRGKAKATPKKRKKEKRYFDETLEALTTTVSGSHKTRTDPESALSSEDELFGLHLVSSTPEGTSGNGQASPGQRRNSPQPVKNKQRAWSPSNPLQDSDSSEDGLAEKEQEALPSAIGSNSIAQSEIPLSTWVSTSSNCYDVPTTSSTSSKLLLLRTEETITLLGVFTFTVLRGDIEYQGVKLSPWARSIEVFAPKCSPLGTFRALSPDPHRTESNLVGLESLPTELQQVIVSHEGSAILISTLRTGIEGLGRVCNTFENMFVPPQGYGGVVSLGLEGVAVIRDTHPQLQPFLVLPSWQHTMDSVMLIDHNEWSTKPPIYLTWGPKGSGKSCFAQMWSGNLLRRYRRVAILDVDPGQPLMSPPGLLSLHIIRSHRFGPSFAHGSCSVKSHFFGSVTPRSSVDRWEELVRDLIQTWRLDWSYAAMEGEITDENSEAEELVSSVTPLVINTHGWVKGYGAELQRRLELMVEPTHIFSLCEANTPEANPLNSTESVHSSALRYTLQPLPPSPLSSRFTANDLRNISILSYFHIVPRYRRPTSSQTAPTVTWDTSKALCDIAPWKVSYGEGKAIRRVYLGGPWADDVVPNEIARVLDCAIVGLMEVDDDILTTAKTDGASTSIPYVQGDEVPLAEYSKCLGLALIRAIDLSSNSFHILTPVDITSLSSCHVLMKSEVRLPVWGFLRFGEAPAADAPYLDWGMARGVRGGEKKRIRRNLMRRSQM